MEERMEAAVRAWLMRRIQAATTIEIAKRTSARAHWQRYRRLLARTQRKLESAVASFFRWLRAELEPGVMAAAKTGNVDAMADWAAIEADGARRMRQPILEAVAAGGRAVVEQGYFQKQEPSFDPVGEEAVSWTWSRSAELVTAISRETRDAIMLIIQDGVRFGWSPQKIARLLRPTLGLLPRHAAAVSRALTKAIEEGVPYEKAMKAAERYARKLHRYRMRMVARTEAAFANSEGIRQGFGQLGVERLRWVADPEACEICAANDGSEFTIAEAEGLIPAHPHCFVGETQVLCPGVTGGYAADYNGPVLRIVFDRGDITVTPNHLLLTPAGFARAASLAKGDSGRHGDRTYASFP